MEIKAKDITFDKIPGINEVDERKSYITSKVTRVQITGTGEVSVNCGFPPKCITTNGTQGNVAFQSFTDFDFSYGIKWYTSLGTFTSTPITDMVDTTTTVGNPIRRLSNGFVVNITSFSGSSFYINFLCLA